MKNEDDFLLDVVLPFPMPLSTVVLSTDFELVQEPIRCRESCQELFNTKSNLLNHLMQMLSKFPLLFCFHDLGIDLISFLVQAETTNINIPLQRSVGN